MSDSSAPPAAPHGSLSERIHTYVLPTTLGILFGSGACLTLAHGGAALQSGVTQGMPWGSPVALALIIVGLVLVAVIVTAAATTSTWALLGAFAVAMILMVTWELTDASGHSLGGIAGQLDWSPFIGGLGAMFLGATYACGSARRAGAHLAHEGTPDGEHHPHLYVPPKPLRFALTVSFAVSLLASLALVAALVWLAANTSVDPQQIVLVSTGPPTRHFLALTSAMLAVAALIMASSVSAIGPIVAAVVVLIAPAFIASTHELYSLGQSLSSNLRALTLASPVLGLWGVLIVVLSFAPVLARREGYRRARIGMGLSPDVPLPH